MGRGDVYLCTINLPNRLADGASDVPTSKLIVLLQGGPAFDSCGEAAFLVASTWRGGSQRPFEVVMGSAEGFQHDTVVDCRWPFTLPKRRIVQGKYLFTLSEAQMRSIALAVVRGLQLR